ncbi:putative nuclease HARBI1 [Diadema antillarum]
MDTFFRKALEPGLKLAITLRYLATGNSYKSLQFGFRVSHSTISIFITEVCQAIVDTFSADVMVCPVTAEAWKKVSEGFKTKWNFPHCVGAIDGKHVAIRCPRKAGSVYFNYKGFHSIVLLALVDAEYKFLYVDIGASGAGSDAGVSSETTLKEALEAGTIGLPDPDPLPHDDRPMPYFIVADDAFALKTWLMKPLPQRNMSVEERVFNYRLSRARRVVENTFGLLASRFRCLLTTMPQTPERVCTITMACCVLHNYLLIKNPTIECNLVDQDNPETPGIIPGAWRDHAHLPHIEEVYRGNINRAAKEQRQYLAQYVNSEAGSVPWQNEKI